MGWHLPLIGSYIHEPEWQIIYANPAAIAALKPWLVVILMLWALAIALVVIKSMEEA